MECFGIRIHNGCEDKIVTMRVSIIGAGRNRNGIGEYIGKYFHRNHANVISVLGTTERTSEKASSALRKYGIECVPYAEFDKMVEKEMPDTIVIASPSSTHYEYLVKCVDLGLNVFCEKPFVWNPTDDMGEAVKDLFKKANGKKITVAMNSQWPFAIPYYKEICGEIGIKRSNKCFVSLSPYSCGKEMIPESVPHTLSLLYFLFGEGEISNLSFDSSNEREMTVTFRYLVRGKDCEVLTKLVSQQEQPRDFQFGFNDKIVGRNLDLQNYDIYLNYMNKRLKILDPLELSVRNFIAAVEKKVEPLIGCSHILNNISLLKEIYDRYERG